MASAKKVIPACGHVYRVYSVLLPVLNINEGNRYQDVFEDAREMRFVLRKFFNAITELTKTGSDDKSAYFEAAREASSSHARPGVAETIGDRTTAALVKILGEAAWGVTANRSSEQQSTNVTLKGIRDGIDATIKSLSEQLKADESEDKEYDVPSSPSAAPETPSRLQQQGSTTGTPSRTPGSSKGNRGPRGAPWRTEEKLEVLRILRDYPDGNHRGHSEELNRRIRALRAARGESQQEPRTRDGFRQQVRILVEDGITIEGLETALH